MRTIVAGLGIVLSCLTGGAGAQEGSYPNRPVHLIIAPAPGGGTDVAARLIALKLGAAMGQPVVVENRQGANGMIAAGAVAKAPPDGYTLYMSLSSIIHNTLLRAAPGYAMTDFVPVCMVVSIPIALAVGGTFPANNVAELVQAARNQPGTVTYGSSGAGSGSHLIGAALATAANVKMTHVPYKGDASSFPDLTSGRLDAVLGSAGFYAAQEASGKAKLLAVTGPRRMARFPNVPTMAEAGYPNANLPGWAGMFAPAGTPPAVVNRLAAEIRKILQDPDVQARLLDQGFVAQGSTPDEFAAYIQNETERWTTVIRVNNISIKD